MRVLVACEFSGVVRDAFIRNGHDAWSCDLIPSTAPGPHIVSDIFVLLRRDSSWDLMISHWPCRYLTNSGARWLYERDGRWELMRRSARNFKRLLNMDIPLICAENPVMHKHAAEIVQVPYTQIIQPHEYGHDEIKKTCLWLKGLKPLQPTKHVAGRVARVHHESPGTKNGLTREQRRSKTYAGIARAMADQWGGWTGYEHLENNS